ncbi:2OG-Fe(II) oxygenase [Marinomonas sp. 2405UD68-3]|uniref:2OG-Fe(II) oxygenase n=1 Tax=Marinomonas sp. 2405UD68-3 TaxID=3391835 RepID=UPI0039C98C31
MSKLDTFKNQESGNSLQRARQLVLPSRKEMLARSPSAQSFWIKNRSLLADAWKEWGQDTSNSVVSLDESVIDDRLRHSVSQAWVEPTTEQAVRDLWEEVAPGVYQTQFFDPQRVASLREYLESAVDAGIPLRPPYGISLNRYGAMLDPRSEGFLGAPAFQEFYDQLLDKYMRPVARLLFPEVMGYDTQTFGFSIKWQEGMDTSLRLHTDASAVTMNINMNLPSEDFTGSEIDFYDPNTGKVKRVSFEAGTAMIHRGHVAHAALPITSGERSNIVLWLYGEGMQIPQHTNQSPVIDAHKRWTAPVGKKDDIAPF